MTFFQSSDLIMRKLTLLQVLFVICPSKSVIEWLYECRRENTSKLICFVYDTDSNGTFFFESPVEYDLFILWTIGNLNINWYPVTGSYVGIFTSAIYAEDCTFEDPTIKFQGKEKSFSFN